MTNRIVEEEIYPCEQCGKIQIREKYRPVLFSICNDCWKLTSPAVYPGGYPGGSEIDRLQKIIGDWADPTFSPGEDPRNRIKNSIKHLKEEVDELLEDPNDEAEYGDILMFILDIARLAGYSGSDLIRFTYEKLGVCKERTWHPPDKDGIIRHVKEEKICHNCNGVGEVYHGRKIGWYPCAICKGTSIVNRRKY